MKNEAHVLAGAEGVSTTDQILRMLEPRNQNIRLDKEEAFINLRVMGLQDYTQKVP